MNYLWLLLIPYCTLTFGIHGGEGITGINRQVRNLLCAFPFGLTAWHVTPLHFDYPAGVVFFSLAYLGVNMGFDSWRLWEKGFVTLPPIGAILLPVAYSINTKWKNVFQEYLSGTLYGIVLFLAAFFIK